MQQEVSDFMPISNRPRTWQFPIAQERTLLLKASTRLGCKPEDMLLNKFNISTTSQRVHMIVCVKLKDIKKIGLRMRKQHGRRLQY